jgi:hypothetical protein
MNTSKQFSEDFNKSYNSRNISPQKVRRRDQTGKVITSNNRNVHHERNHVHQKNQNKTRRRERPNGRHEGHQHGQVILGKNNHTESHTIDQIDRNLRRNQNRLENKNIHGVKHNIHETEIIEFPDETTHRTTPHLKADVGSGENFDDFSESIREPQAFDTFANQNQKVMKSMTNLKNNQRKEFIKPTGNIYSDGGQMQRNERHGNQMKQISRNDNRNRNEKYSSRDAEYRHNRPQQQHESGRKQLKMIPDEYESDISNEGEYRDQYPDYHKFLQSQQNKNPKKSREETYEVFRKPFKLDIDKDPEFEKYQVALNEDIPEVKKDVVYSKVPEEDIQANYDVGRAKVQTNMTYSNKLIKSRPPVQRQRYGNKNRPGGLKDLEASEDRQIYFKKSDRPSNGDFMYSRNNGTDASDSNMRFY